MALDQIETRVFVGSQLTDFDNLSGEDQNTAIALLAKEFYGRTDVEKGLTAFDRTIRSGKEKCVIAKMGQEIAGVATLKEYAFDQIAAQLFIDAKYQDGYLESIRLKPFGQLVAEHGYPGEYTTAEELAYVTVVQKYRGMKLSGELFQFFTDQIARKRNPSLIFTIARGDFAHSGVQSLLTNYMLDVEKDKNGLREDGKVKVTGVWIDTEQASAAVGYVLANITPYSGSSAAIKTIEKYGGKPVGFYRNMSPVWCMDKDQINLESGAIIPS